MFSVGIGLFMMPFLVHSLGDELYGLWVLIGSIVAFYELMDIGLSDAMQRFMVRAIHGKEKNDTDIALSNSVALTIAVAILLLFVTLVIVFLVPLFSETEKNISTFQYTIGILGASAAIQFPFYPFYWVVVAKYRQDIIGYSQLCALILRTILTVYFVSNGHGIITIAAVMFFTKIASSVLIVMYSRKLAPEIKLSTSCLNPQVFKEYYHYGKYVYIIKMSDKIRFSIDNIVVGSIIGIGAITHYTIAVTLTQYFGRLIRGLYGVINPVLHKYHKLEQWDNLRKIFLIITEVSTLTSILIGGLLVILGDSFIVLWVGNDYSDAYPILLILCFSSVAINAQQPSEQILYAIAKHKYQAKITSIEAVINLGVSVVLGYYMGIVGVALGTTIPALFNALILRPRYTCRQLSIPYPIYYKILGKGLVAGVTVFIPGYIAVQTLGIKSWTVLVIYGLSITSIFIIFCTRLVMNKKTASYIVDSVPQRITPFVRLLAGCEDS